MEVLFLNKTTLLKLSKCQTEVLSYLQKYLHLFPGKYCIVVAIRLVFVSIIRMAIRW